jgi:hypothetical protein
MHEFRERLDGPLSVAFLAAQELAIGVVQAHLAGRDVPFPQRETGGLERELELAVVLGVLELGFPQVVDEGEAALAQDPRVHVGTGPQGGDQAPDVRACPEAERLTELPLQLAIDRLAHGASSGIPTLSSMSAAWGITVAGTCRPVRNCGTSHTGRGAATGLCSGP